MTNDELAARVESLERGMQRWRRLATVLVLGLLVAGFGWSCSQGEEPASDVEAGAATGQEEVPDVVKAREFQVVDKDGKDVVSLSAGVDGGRVMVKNKAGGLVVRLGAMNGSGLVNLVSGAGKIVVTLGAVGRDSDGLVVVHDKTGRPVWQAPPK